MRTEWSELELLSKTDFKMTVLDDFVLSAVRCCACQRDQMLKLKVAQIFPKVAQNVAKAVFT